MHYKSPVCFFGDTAVVFVFFVCCFGDVVVLIRVKSISCCEIWNWHIASWVLWRQAYGVFAKPSFPTLYIYIFIECSYQRVPWILALCIHDVMILLLIRMMTRMTSARHCGSLHRCGHFWSTHDIPGSESTILFEQCLARRVSLEQKRRTWHFRGLEP